MHSFVLRKRKRFLLIHFSLKGEPAVKYLNFEATAIVGSQGSISYEVQDQYLPESEERKDINAQLR